jgi:shikimate kinase
MKIFIIGMPLAGKSSLGKKLARNLNFNCIDTDILIENQFNMSTVQMFTHFGEDFFRNEERKLKDNLRNMDNVVISTGGGFPCFNQNIEFIKKNGISVYLKADVDFLLSRLACSQKPRPLLQQNQREILSDLLQKREKCYSQADIIVDAKDINVKNLQLLLEKM